jgi:hypothetical protein
VIRFEKVNNFSRIAKWKYWANIMEQI